MSHSHQKPGADGAAKKAAIEIRDLKVELGGNEILAGVNATIWESEITALIGPNGAGKTTLLLCILDMIPYHGTIKRAARNGHSRVGYVPQQLEFDRGMPMTVLDFMCMSRQRAPLWWSREKGAVKRARAMLKRVEAEKIEGRRVGALSGGELQRVLLAMALLEEPSILMLDEPASAVDRSGEELFMNLIRSLHAETGMSILMVSHDLSMVTRLAQQVICINREVLSEGKASEVLTEKTLSACFGADKGLLLHDHSWGAELSCAYDDTGAPAVKPKE